MSNLDHSLKAAADFGELPALRLEPQVLPGGNRPAGIPADPVAVESRQGT